MNKSRQPYVRELLRAHPEGLTIRQLQQRMNKIKPSSVHSCLRKMPDAYIDRWVLEVGSRGQFHAVWCVAIPPADCPYPTERPNRAPAKTKWLQLGAPT